MAFLPLPVPTIMGRVFGFDSDPAGAYVVTSHRRYLTKFINEVTKFVVSYHAPATAEALKLRVGCTQHKNTHKGI